LNEFVRKHIIIVRYTGIHSPYEGVYTSANIDAQDVIGRMTLARRMRVWSNIIRTGKSGGSSPRIDFTRLDLYGDKS
jgi:hypothetical protein